MLKFAELCNCSNNKKNKSKLIESICIDQYDNKNFELKFSYLNMNSSKIKYKKLKCLGILWFFRVDKNISLKDIDSLLGTNILQKTLATFCLK